MGVPAMFRWLSQKYPKIISTVLEDQPKEIAGEKIPVDRTQPNPNGEEFDNLYLDMNGIVHPCSHPEDRPAPKTEADMMVAIFEATDRVVGMVRPRKLLYLAVDGVAPRAKMNQQRSRRFRSAKEAKEKDDDSAEFLKLLNSQKASRGEDITTLDQVVEKTWDSNVITPGTPFMHLLAESLQYWCAYKFTTDPSWKDMKVIISDASVPGEGEHKIMNFIRSQRAMPTHDPNTRHVIYGLDADLIMLGLATHEPHFRVLREDVFFDSGKDKTCTRCGRKGHIVPNCTFPDDGKKLTEDEAKEEWNSTEHPPKPYIWLHVNVLREYLAIEMEAPGRSFDYNLERALDDWVFMCFFVGNDFLPHLPSLEIRDQGIETLIGIWRDLVPTMTDYVTNNGYPDMKRVQQILNALASKEAEIFRKRKEVSDRQAANRARREAQSDRYSDRGNRNNGQPPHKRFKEDTNTILNAGIPFFAPGEAQSNEVRNVHKDLMANRNQENKSAAAKLKELMKAKAEGKDSATASATEPEMAVSTSPLGKRKADALEESDNGTPAQSTPDTPAASTPAEPATPAAPTPKEGEMPEDTIKLWEPGYEDRYYAQKFNVAPEDKEFRHKVAREYARGLCWVLAYYMQGCPSWTWYFPYHYAPFASDFVDLETLDPRDFSLGQPFKPYEQLMGVLPAASNHAIPEPFRILMSDPDSPIVDFYPEDFPIDLNGKKFAWQGVALLPFIDEKRLLEAMNKKYPELSDDEHRRNETGKETLMFSQESALFDIVDHVFYRQKGKESKEPLEMDPAKSNKLHGKVEAHDEFVVDSTLAVPFDTSEVEFNEVDLQDRSVRMYYEMPRLKAKNAHKSKLLDGVIMPKPSLTEEDKSLVKSRRGGRGGRGGGRGGGGGYGGRGSYNNGNDRGGYNNNNNNGYSRGGGYDNNNSRGGGYGGGRGGYDNQRGGYSNHTGGYQQPFQPPPGFAPPPGYPPPQFAYPPPGGRGFQAPPGMPPGMPPIPGWDGRGPPPPPPGWTPPNQGQYQGQQQQRPAWMQQQPPPPGQYNGGGGGGSGYGGQGQNGGGGYRGGGNRDNQRGGQGYGGRGGGGRGGGGYSY